MNPQTTPHATNCPVYHSDVAIIFHSGCFVIKGTIHQPRNGTQMQKKNQLLFEGCIDHWPRWASINSTRHTSFTLLIGGGGMRRRYETTWPCNTQKQQISSRPTSPLHNHFQPINIHPSHYPPDNLIKISHKTFQQIHVLSRPKLCN